MRWLRRILLVLLLVAALPVLAIAGLFVWHALNPLDYDGSIEIAGPGAPVTIRFDAQAVPHIRAESLEDASFALGWLHARERLFQMESNRRIGAGRMAELIGPPGLGFDRFMRVLGIYRLAEADYAAMAAEPKSALDAYVAGVNAWIASPDAPLPVEFHLLLHRPEPWQPADSLVWTKLMALQLSGNWRGEMTRAQRLRRLTPEQIADLDPQAGAGSPVTLAAQGRRTDLPEIDWDRLAERMPPPLGPARASNMWVLDGSRTDTGAPILVNDPHLGLSAPSLWYLVHIETPDLTLSGATVPGVPFVILGRNQHLAWGLTTTGADVQDLFIQRIDPDDPTRYLTPDGSRAFEERVETIAVRFAKEERLRVRTTRHGPVLSDIDDDAAAIVGADHALALAFTALEPGDTTMQALHGINQATNWREFRQAARAVKAPMQNITYADRRGTIGFIAPALIPIRASGDGTLPRPGWTGDFDWTGFVPFEELPQAVNAPSGHFINANNAITGPDYPHLISLDYEPPYRAERIETVLASRAAESLSSSRGLLADIYTGDADNLLPILLETPPVDARSATALDRLVGWDRAMTETAAEPLIYTGWIDALGAALWSDEIGDAPAPWGLRPQTIHHMLTQATAWCDDLGTAETEDCPAIQARALATALERLTEAYGEEMGDWRWGAAHPAPQSHPILGFLPGFDLFFGLSRETDGGDFTVKRAASGGGEDGVRYPNRHGAGYRAVYDLSAPEGLLTVISTGQSGRPGSAHWGDFVDLWAEGGLRPLPTSDGVLARDGLGSIVLRPPGSDPG